jgi:Flp pilus assembly protein TadD
VAGPVAAVSYRVVQRISILPYSGGINFYIGNNPNYKQTATSRPGLEWLEIANLPKHAGLEDRHEAQRFFYKKTFDYIVTQPMSFLNGLGYKTAQFFNSREMPRNLDIYLFRKWAWLLWAGVWKAGGFGFPFGVLLPLAVVGAVYWRRSVPGPVWLFMIFYPLSLILVFVTSRYRMPVVPVMSVLAAAGCTAICRIFQQSRWSGLAVVAVFIFAVGWAGAATGPFYEEQLDYEPELYYELGGSLYEYGRTEESIEAHSKAIELKSDYFKALHNLGSILTLQGRFKESIKYYRDALKVKDDDISTHNNLAVALQKQGELEEAIKHYECSLQLKSDQPKVLRILAYLYFLQGQTAHAVDKWTQFLKFEPDAAEVIDHLAWVKATYQDSHFYNPDEAVRLAMRACELTEYKQAVFMDTLAVAYAAAGDFAAAIRTGEEAAKLAAGDEELVGEIRSRIQLYKAGRCYREMGP